MKYKRIGNSYVIRLDKGDEIVEKLTEFCAKEKIKAGYLSGIGGTARVEVAYYDIRDKQYHSKVFDRPPYEIVSLVGNVSLSDGEIKIHAHIVISDSECRAFGGHLNEAKVFPLCEIVFTPLKTELKRAKDKETGLMILDI